MTGAGTSGGGASGSGGSSGGGASGSGGAPECVVDADCIPKATQWVGPGSIPCSSSANCTGPKNTVCINVAGSGSCAQPVPVSGTCPVAPYPDKINMPLFGASGTVDVCSDKSQTCFQGECFAF